MRRTSRALIAVIALAAGLTLTGCKNPCDKLAPPTAAEREVVSNAGDDLEIEREVGGTDCRLTESGKWVKDD